MTDPANDSSERLRCSVGARGEQLAGTAAVDAAYLLVEHPGPWGRKALAESGLPEHVRTGLAEAADEAGVRVQLIRRHGRTPSTEAFRVFLGHAAPGAAWLETTVLEVADDLLDLDLDGLAEGRSAGLEPVEHQLLLVCTNGRRDACCAEFGRPVATALSATHPQETWETTHLGGHRFAGAMLALPHGISYGRLDVDSAARVARATLAGELVPELMRGRTAYAPAVQAAEIALLGRLGERRVEGLELVEVSPPAQATSTPATTSSVVFRHARDGDTQVHRVLVTETPGTPVRTSCADAASKPTRRFRIEIGRS
ncbi:sucrase ferredoxin [Nocardioides jensenii]|uniref:sucrase ferredoxin n=1 Tax=Nocardioides jensenii TaxID=1843 RepID=UPI0008369453|nr:sucrase ferredoxin [Nocardioides jensenii]